MKEALKIALDVPQGIITFSSIVFKNDAEELEPPARFGDAANPLQLDLKLTVTFPVDENNPDLTEEKAKKNLFFLKKMLTAKEAKGDEDNDLIPL